MSTYQDKGISEAKEREVFLYYKDYKAMYEGLKEEIKENLVPLYPWYVPISREPVDAMVAVTALRNIERLVRQ